MRCQGFRLRSVRHSGTKLTCGRGLTAIYSHWVVRFGWTAPLSGNRDFGGMKFGERSECGSLYIAPAYIVNTIYSSSNIQHDHVTSCQGHSLWVFSQLLVILFRIK